MTTETARPSAATPAGIAGESTPAAEDASGDGRAPRHRSRAAASESPAARARDTDAVAGDPAARGVPNAEFGTEDALSPAPDDRASEVPAYFGLRRADQLVVGVLVFAALVLGAVYWARLSGWGLEPIEIERLAEREHEFRLDMNTATWIEWMQLPQIGEILARRIVADRDVHGPFENIDDLQRVRGIGPKTVERIRPWLREPQAAIDHQHP